MPTGGRFAPSTRDEAPVALEVEFAADEAEQVDQALGEHRTALVSRAVTPDTSDTSDSDRSLVWSPEARAAWAANQSARATLRGLRIHLTTSDFASRAFTAEEIRAMEVALDFRRQTAQQVDDREDLAAVDAARFRLGIAQPLVREADLPDDLPEEPNVVTRIDGNAS